MNGRATLPPQLLAKLDAFLLAHPKHVDIVERLLERRERASTDKERLGVEKMLNSLATPSRAGWYLGGAILLFVGGVIGYTVVSEHNHAEAVAAGDKVVAYIERMDDGDCAVGTKTTTCVHLVLELHPRERASYRAELTHDVSNRYMARMQPGSWLTVAVSREDPSLVYLDEESLAVPPPPPVKH